MAVYTEDRQIEALGVFDSTVIAPKNVDLSTLIPEKFTDSVLLDDFLTEAGEMVGIMMSKVDELGEIISPYKVGDDLIGHLAGNIGFVLLVDEETTLAEKRKQLLSAVDWIKAKGTYDSMRFQAKSNNLTPIITDYYVNDASGDYEDFDTYVGFQIDSASDWFVGSYEGENPPGLDASYFKTPHFGFEILIDRRYVGDNQYDDYVWSQRLANKLDSIVERGRPINTVPHKGTVLAPVCTEDGEAYVTAYDLATATHDDWTTARFNLDTVVDAKVVDSSTNQVVDGVGDDVIADAPAWYLDAGITLDFASNPVLTAVQKWKLGTGNKYRNYVTDTFDADTATALNGHAPDYNENSTLWSDASGAFTFQDGVLSVVSGSFDANSYLDLGATGFDITYEAYVSDSSAAFMFRKLGGFYHYFAIEWVGHWRWKLVPRSGSTLIDDWDGGSVGWHTVRIRDNGYKISVWVDGVLLVDEYETTLDQAYTQIGFIRQSASVTTKFRNLVIDRYRSPGRYGWAMANEVLNGTIDSTTIYADRVEYEFTIASTVTQAGMSELGLYTLADGLRLAAEFPDLDKIEGQTLRVLVTVYQEEVPE